MHDAVTDLKEKPTPWKKDLDTFCRPLGSPTGAVKSCPSSSLFGPSW